MKLPALFLFLSLLCTGSMLHAQGGSSTMIDTEELKPKKPTSGERASEVTDKIKANRGKAEDALKKLIGEVSKAAEKVDEKDVKGLWAATKDNLKLSRAEYAKKATSAMATMDAEIQDLTENGGPVITRDYFKPRLDSLKLQLDYCKRDFVRLTELPTEEAFRVKQKSFDRTLGFLSDTIELAREEAGL